MAWDTAMPTEFTDGQNVDEGDMDPIVKNLAQLQYSTVFLAGVNRVTQVTGINSTTQVIVLQLPAVQLEAGYLYKIEGLLRVINTVSANTAPGLYVHEGSTTAGATVQVFTMPPIDTTLNTTGHGMSFSVYVRATATAPMAYNVAVNRHRGTGTLIIETLSFAAILRCGDSSLMTDV